METTNETLQAPVHYNPNQLVTYKVISNDTTTYPTSKVTDIEWALESYRTMKEVFYTKSQLISNLEDMLAGWIEDETSAEDIVSEICNLFGFNPTKTVDFTATVRVHGSIEVPLNEINQFDLDSYVSDGISVDTIGSSVDISSWDIEQVDEC
jgi:hypothetical protein